MGIKVNNAFKVSPKFRKEADERAKTVVKNVLSFVGERAVTEARDHGSYTDQTGNLRSSIGYVVVSDGKVEGEQKKYKDGADGLTKGKEMLDRLAQKREGDIDLHIVAGMDYADYVERIHHKNVLSSARVLADKEVPEMLETAGLIIKKR